MRRIPASIFSIVFGLGLLSGCALTPEAPVEEASPVVAAPAVEPLASEADLPVSRSALVLPPASKPAMHSNVTTARPAVLSTRRQAPQAVALPVKFVEQALASGIGAPGPGAALRTAPAGKDAKKAEAGPAWLKACQHRQQQADVIMCDADSLLAPPSDKVMVYVRDAKLSGMQAGGQRIALRESLPRLYRLFVLD